MSLKDQLLSDLDIFFNTDEFGELHTINGRQLSVIVDNDRLKERGSHSEYGYEGDLLIYVSAVDYGPAPVVGEILEFDNEKYRVSDVQENIGVYSITLVANL